MCDAMEEAIMEAGGNFVFNTELSSVEYGEDSFTAKFSDGQVIDDGMLFLCLDNSPALTFLGDNWGPDADKKVRESTYGAINVLLDYEDPIKKKPILRSLQKLNGIFNQKFFQMERLFRVSYVILPMKFSELNQKL